jgi:beta-phosphoglucomutase
VIKLVIFDLDGVLADTCDWHRVSLNESLKSICNYEISLNDHKSAFNGLPTKTKLQKLTDLGFVAQDDHDNIYNLKQKFLIDIIRDSGGELSDKIDLIEFLKLNSCIVSCFTNCSKITTKLILESIKIFDMLDCVVTNEDVKKPKPDPEGYNFIVDKFGCNPEDVLIIEDSPKGKEAAYSSGCNVIEVENSKVVNIKLLANYFK